MKELQVYKVTFSVKKRKSFQKRYMALDLKGQSSIFILLFCSVQFFLQLTAFTIFVICHFSIDQNIKFQNVSFYAVNFIIPRNQFCKDDHWQQV